MAYLVLHQQDCVGLATFDSEVRAILRPSGNPSHLQDLLQVIEDASPGRKTAIGPILHDLAERLKRRGIVIILSDMFDELGPVLAGLKHLRHRRHEVILMHVLDPAEIEFPFEQATLFVGLEERGKCRPTRPPCAGPTRPSSAPTFAGFAPVAASKRSTTCCCGPIVRWVSYCPAIWRRDRGEWSVVRGWLSVS